MNTLLRAQNQILFRAAKDKHLKLKRYGFNEHLPCISAKACLNDDHNKQLLQQLAQLNRPALTANKTQQLHEGTLKGNQTRRVKKSSPLVVEPGEGGYLEHSHAQWHQRRSEKRTEKEETQPKAVSPTSLELLCPRCGFAQVAKHGMLRGTVWKQPMCRQPRCRKPKKASRWLCGCGVPWHTCTMHRTIGFQLPGCKRTVKSPTPVIKRSAGALGSKAARRRLFKQSWRARHAQPVALGEEPFKQSWRARHAGSKSRNDGNRVTTSAPSSESQVKSETLTLPQRLCQRFKVNPCPGPPQVPPALVQALAHRPSAVGNKRKRESQANEACPQLRRRGRPPDPKLERTIPPSAKLQAYMDRGLINMQPATKMVQPATHREFSTTRGLGQSPHQG